LPSAIDFFEELLGTGGRPARKAGPALLHSLTLIFDLTEDVAQEQHRHTGEDDHRNDRFHANPFIRSGGFAARSASDGLIRPPSLTLRALIPS